MLYCLSMSAPGQRKLTYSYAMNFEKFIFDTAIVRIALTVQAQARPRAKQSAKWCTRAAVRV